MTSIIAAELGPSSFAAVPPAEISVDKYRGAVVEVISTAHCFAELMFRCVSGFTITSRICPST
jgi:hypothetical protein